MIFGKTFRHDSWLIISAVDRLMKKTIGSYEVQRNTGHRNHEKPIFRKRHTGYLLLSVFFLLVACAPQTEEEQIAAVNRRIAPDGYLTKTHLYIHWPAVYTQPKQYGHKKYPGSEEIVPAITLKIPFEYLSHGIFSYENMLKQRLPELRNEDASKINYVSRINAALFIFNRQITSVSLKLLPGNKPYVPMVPYDTDPPELAQRKLENFFGFYAVHINRNDYMHKSPILICVGASCSVHFSVGGRQAKISGQGESLENYYKAKAKRSTQKNAEPTPTPPTAQSQSDLPKWHEKVDPTQALLNNFVLPEDSPEVQGLFYQEVNK